jgi:hypothetical protein
VKFVDEYQKLQYQLFLIREARFRGRSTWARDYWSRTEAQLIKRFNHTQGVDYAKLVL